MRYYPNGLLSGGSGDTLVASTPVYGSPLVYYVSSVTGNDANSGISQEGPKATLGAAYTAAAAGDIIVLAANHDESLTSPVTFAKQLTVVGAGSAGGVPTAKLRLNHATNPLLQFTANQCQVRNIYFAENAQLGTGTKVQLAAPLVGFRMFGCYFEHGDNDGYDVLALANAAARSVFSFRNCSWVNTQTVYAATGSAAVSLLDVDDVELTNCLFDGGTAGFGANNPQSIAGLALHVGASSRSPAGFFADGVTLLRGADVYVTVSSPEWLSGVTATGAAQVVMA